MTTFLIPDTQRPDAFRRDAALRRLARQGRGRRRHTRRTDAAFTKDADDRHHSSP